MSSISNNLIHHHSKLKNQSNNFEPFKIKNNNMNNNINNNINQSNNSSEEILINNLFYNVKNYLISENGENEWNELTRSEILNYLHKSLKLIDNKLITELNEVETKYFDIIPYGNMSCKEWLNSKSQKIKIEKEIKEK